MHMHTLYLVVMEGRPHSDDDIWTNTWRGWGEGATWPPGGENIPVTESSAKALRQEQVYSVQSHLLSQEVSFSKFKKIQFIKNMLSDHSGHKLK